MEKKLYEKKGQAGMAVGAIITLFVGVGVAVLVNIFIGALGGQTYNLVEPKIDAIGNTSIVNLTLPTTPNTISAVGLGHSNIHSGTLSLANASSGAAASLTNFTIDYDAGTILVKSAGTTWNNTDLLASYHYGDYTIGQDVKDSIKSSFSALKQTSDYLPVVVLAVVISLVLALVLSFGAFNGGGMGGRGSAL